MANALVSSYGIGDTNFDALMISTDAQRLGHMALSLSNFDNDSAPVIESGSKVDVGGALYKFTSDESISTTDPYTSATVADGTVYIVLRKNMGTAIGSTTDATGYAIGSTVITLDSAGTGTILVGDRIKFVGDDISYEVTSGDSDVSNGGSITIASPGIYTAIPASATAITISSGSVLAYWTATAPVWRADYQGWYKTATVDRYIGGCELSGTTTVFDAKYIYDKNGIFKGYPKTKISAYLTSDITGTSAEHPLIFDTEVFDSKNEYDPSTGLVTIKKGGYYQISFGVDVFCSNYFSGYARLFKNSQALTFCQFTIERAGSNDAYLTGNKLIKCIKGDVLKVTTDTVAATIISGGVHATFLTIYEI